MSFAAHSTTFIAWSGMSFPTAGRSRMVLIPRPLRCSRLPIPESMRIWGELMTPADKINSFEAVRVFPTAPVAGW